LPDVTSDARQRRLTYLINTASLARTTPALYVIEDAHWIDEVSGAMIAEFASVIPQAHAMVLVTYRPEYRGALKRPPNAHKLALVPLDGGEASALTTELVGSHPSVTAVAAQIAERAAGNPFFVQEIVRDLAERGVLDGNRGAYVCHRDIGDVGVPATVQAAIAARIDRLDAAAKRTLNAASVIGLRCSEDLLTCVLGEADAGGAHGAALSGLVGAELLDQVMFTPPRRICLLPPPYPHRGLRVAAQIKPCRPASTLGRRDPTTRPVFGRRERRTDRRTPAGRR
jgi:predicted ATPase